MAEEPDKKDDEKLEFDSTGQAIGYISLDQASVLAMRTAREAPGDYGSQYQGVSMAFQVVEDTETEDHYVVTLSFRPQGQFSGTLGQEQFFIEKEGTVAHRQVMSLPRRGRRFPVLPVAIGVVIVGVIIAGGAVFMLGGTGDDRPLVAVAAPTETREPVVAPTPTYKPTPAAIPTATLLPTDMPVSTPSLTPVPLPTPTPTGKTGIEGRFLFNGEPITNFTQRYPLFRIKERNSQQSCADANSKSWRPVYPNYNDTTGVYALIGLEAGSYCHLVGIDAAEPSNKAPNFPGDFGHGPGHGTEFSLQPGETKTLDLGFHKFIHLTSPIDNSRNQIMALSPGSEIASPVQITWDSITGARIYTLTIRTCGDATCTDGSTVLLETTPASPVEVTLPPSEESRNYVAIIRAYNTIGDTLGKVWVRYGNSWLDGAPFRVAASPP